MHALADGLEAVVFDVGNTLCYLDYERLVSVLARHGLVSPELTPELAAQAERRARPLLSRYLHEHRASTEDPRSFRRYVELALERAGVTPPPERLEVAFADLCREHRRVNFFGIAAPGALEAVTALRRRYKLAVVSNAGGKVAGKLHEVGFGPHLLSIVDSGIEGVEKPDPRIFLAGCARAGVAPERALYVGDLHAIDVLGARGAGMRAALLDPAGAYAEHGLADVALFADVAALARALLDDGPLA